MSDFNSPDVIPNDAARNEAASLRRLCILEVCLLAPLILLGQLWIVLQVLTVGLAWFAINDKTIYKTKLLLVFFVATVFGGIFVGVDVLMSLSFVFTGIKPREGELPVDTPKTGGLMNGIMGLYLGCCLATLTLAGRSAWKLYKILLTCQPATANASGWLSQGLNPTQYAAPLFANLRRDSGAEEPRSFVPFQGQGQRVVDV